MKINHPIGLFGWGNSKLSIQKNTDVENIYYAKAAADNPIAYKQRPTQELSPEILAAWNEFQLSEGREAGSNDMTLLTKFVFGKKYIWLPQDTGSCVFSNTFRAFVARMLYEIMLKGDPEEWFGPNEFGVNSIAPHMITYGFARQRANMKGGDGLYCEPMIESLMKDGVVTCNTPKLKEIMDANGAKTDKNYPEPRSTALIRKLQNWAFNDVLKPYADFRLMESVKLTSGQMLDDNAKESKPAMMCSGIAIKIKEKNPDGFNVHVRDTGDTWSHNMSFQGRRLDKRNNIYEVFSNESWVPEGSDDPEKYIYNVPIEETDKWLKSGDVTCMTIGEIDLPDSLPVLTI